MKKVKDFSFLIIGIIILLGIIIYGWIGYFIVRVKGNIMVDGWDRTMYQPPSYLTTWGIDEWRGYAWFGIDGVIFLVSICVIFYCFDRYKNRHKYK